MFITVIVNITYILYCIMGLAEVRVYRNLTIVNVDLHIIKVHCI